MPGDVLHRCPEAATSAGVGSSWTCRVGWTTAISVKEEFCNVNFIIIDFFV